MAKKDGKCFECPICHKSMNRKSSFDRHKKSCVDKTKGAKSRNFSPYQCPSPSMAHKSAGAFIGSFQSKLSDIYTSRSSYHEVDDNDEADNIHRQRPWHQMLKGFRNINFLSNHHYRKNGFLPMPSDVDTAEIGVLRLAMVSLGSHHSLTRDLDTWYTLPETHDHQLARQEDSSDSVQLNSVSHFDLPCPCSQEDQARRL